MSDTITLESLKALYDSLPKPPQFFVGPETDMGLLAEVLNLTVLKPRGEGLATLFSPGAPMIGRDIKTWQYLAKNVLMICAEDRLTYFDLVKREGWSMPNMVHISEVGEWNDAEYKKVAAGISKEPHYYSSLDMACPNSDKTVVTVMKRNEDGTAEVVEVVEERITGGESDGER